VKKRSVLLIGTEPDRMIRLQRVHDSLISLGVNVSVFKPVDRPRGRPRILKGIVRYLVISLQLLLSRADIYHFFNVPDNVGMPLLLKRGTLVYDVRTPWAAVLEGTFGKSPLVIVARTIEKTMTRSADQVVCVNSMLAERAVSWGAKSVVVIPNYPAEDFGPSKDREEFRRALCLNGAPVVLYLGKLSKVEGIDLLMDVIKTTCKAMPNLRFLVVGAGPEEHKLKHFIESHSLESQVMMTGWVPHEDVANYINVADVCLLPRPWDSCSPFIGPESVWKAGEYLSLGKPVVAPRMGGFASAPFPVLPVDPSEMADAIINYFKNMTKKPITPHPRWPESHRRLKELYTRLGAI